MSFWRSPCCSLFLPNDVKDYTLTSFATKSHLLAVELSSASWRVRTLSSAWKELDLICVAQFEINWVYEEILMTLKDSPCVFSGKDMASVRNKYR